MAIPFFLVSDDGTCGFPLLEHDMQTLNTVLSIKTVFLPSVTLRPHSSQKDSISVILTNLNLAFSSLTYAIFYESP